jgi:16S rRNA (cytosine967-C5)-methyltransferase
VRGGGATASRKAALDVALAVARGLRLDVALERHTPGLEPRERAFLHELTFGASRLRGRLDHLLAARVRGGLPRLDPAVLEILRLGGYQVLYMGSVPGYAAVSQSVELARRHAGRGAAGLVNAVLRGVADDGDGKERFPPFEGDPVGFLSTWGSHPRWMVERWLSRWSPHEVRALVEAGNRRPPVHLVPLELGPDGAVAALAGKGIAAEAVGAGTGCVRLADGSDPAAALGAVSALVQDPAAHLVIRYADVPAGMKVADLCAAPGGKALALAARVAYTLAADRSETRMRRIRENADRTGLRPGLVVADARHPPIAAMDGVLLDVPCSGTGTLARHPDGRWRVSRESMEDMIRLQREMLDAGADAVRPGGLLVYSTCTLEPEENQEQVEAFLARRRDFVLDASGAVPGTYLDGRGCLEVLPQRHGFDGAFAARMRRMA